MLVRLLAGAFAAVVLTLTPPVRAAGEPFDLGRTALERIDGTPGVGIAIGTIENGKTTVVLRGETGSTQKLGRDTVFEIGSVTKTFTGLLLAEMAGRGEVRLDEPIEDLLPKGDTAPVRGGRHITLLDLATQSSGLPRLPDNLAPRDPRDPYAGYDDARLFEFLSQYRLTRDIGAQYEYSNVGVGLLGRLLALRAGTTYEALLRERVLDPLDMHATAVVPTEAMRAHLAVGHDVDGEPAHTWSLDALAGAGGLSSSLGDMLRYLRAVSAGDGPLGAAARMAEEPRREAFAGTRIGLTWNTNVADGIVWHNGETGGYRAFAGFSADRTRAIVILANSTLPIDDIAFHWLDPALPLAAIPQTIPIARDALGAYVGTYDLSGTPLVFTREGDRLYAKLGEQPRFRVYPYAADAFFWKVVTASVTFTVKDGKATSLVLHQNGRDFSAQRTSD
jgi:CubicO group peptidase (beta-lactamase class C family)